MINKMNLAGQDEAQLIRQGESERQIPRMRRSRGESTREEMIQHFSLERVNASGASFDPQKLYAFQQRYMDRLPIKQKTKAALGFLQKADLVSDPPDCDQGPYLSGILEAAKDRIKIAGNVLDFDDFYVEDDQLVFDDKAFEKRLVKPAEAAGLLQEFRGRLADQDPFTAAELETLLKSFVEAVS